MKIFDSIDDRKHFFRSYRLFGREIFRRYDHSGLYRQYRKYQDCALMAYKLLGFCDIKSCKQATGELRRRQLRMKDVLVGFDRFAQEQGLTYWLEFGNLLGAYRHRGFIPWDYDSDICMLREDIYQNLPLIRSFIEQHFDMKLTPVGAHHKYYYHFASADETLSFDIFAIDALTTSVPADKLSDEIRKIHSRIKSLSLDGSITPENHLEIISKIIDGELMQRFNDDKGTPVLVYGPDYGHPQANLVLRREDVFPLVKLPFEDMQLPAPCEYRKVLASQYGDIDQFPPLMMEYEATNDHDFGTLTYPPGISGEYLTDIDTRYATAVLDGKQS